MSTQVVCISRTIGAGGEVVGRVVAERLGFRYVDDQIIERAAQLAQVDPRLVADAEQRHSALERLTAKLAAAYELIGPLSLATGVPLDAVIAAPVGYRATPDDMRTLIRAAIHEVAHAGQAVIVAHAASMALAGTEGVLRVLVTASPETRAQRLAAAQGIPAPEAARTIRVSDDDRRDYFRRFYQINNEQPTHYDLIINTDALTGGRAVDVILAAVGQER